MIRNYIIVMLGITVFGAYFMGYRIGRAVAIGECNNVATKHLIQTVKQTEKINEQVNHTAVRDIRRVLREKYSIAE